MAVTLSLSKGRASAIYINAYTVALPKSPPCMTKYFVYILKCSDESYYTGITNNLERRLAEHEEGCDSLSYTYIRRPLHLAWYEVFQSPTAAIAFEKQIKGWSRRKKEALIDGRFDLLPDLAKSKKGN